MTELPPPIKLSGGHIVFPDSACSICIRDDAILFTLQSRDPLGIESIELPGGKVESGEDPVSAALRELREETGYRVGSGELIVTLDLDLSVSVHRTHLVKVAEPSAQAGTGESPTQWIGVEAAVQLVIQGRITHAPSVAGVLLAKTQDWAP